MTPATSIPVVDLAPWSSGSGSDTDRKRIAAELTEACRAVGFVYVVNHGMPGDLLEEAFDWVRRLFGLDIERKMLAPHPPGSSGVHRGYSWPGLEKVSQTVYADGDEEKQKQIQSREVPDVKESYEIGSEDNPRQPNIWLPEDVLPGFREFMTRFYWRCFDIAKTLLRVLALGLGLDDDLEFFLKRHSGVNNQLRLLHYPPVEVERVVNGEVARMPAHSDWGTITMLFQDSMGGLQVEDPKEQGHFVDATPLPGALVMNVGDLLMRWSNDTLKSTLHRVSLPPLNNNSDDSDVSRPRMTQSRYSIPYFVSPDPTAVIECLALGASGDDAGSKENNDTAPKYPPVTQQEYGRMRAKGQYL
ncbi:hypothetical protein F4678DRAFT_429696 [Xylaria arbuscula]|nr:hypothetical protein F4678DRAFT_429696 [Xylaria arbuscula]